GTTPLGWARRMRLARARQQLLAVRTKGSVTGVALANGFTELGRFASQYRRQFGELPSQTLRAVRGMSLRSTDEFADEALRLSWRALTSTFMVGPGLCSAALTDAEHAQELAPDQALPKAIAAWCWSPRAAHHFSDTPQLDRAQPLRLADQAARLAPDDAITLSLCSGALTLTRRLANADRLIERALALDPLVALGLGAAWLVVGLH